MDRKCAICGENFEPRTANQKYCSETCRKIKKAEKNRKYRAANKEKIVEKNRKYYAANKEKIVEWNRKCRAANKEKIVAENHFEMEKTCPVCGKKFTPAQIYQVYCSRQCFNKRHEKRKYEKPSLNENICKADECGLSYGKYMALVSMGKTYEEILKMQGRSAS